MRAAGGTMNLADIGKIQGARPVGYKSKLNMILPPLPPRGAPSGTLGESVGGLTRIQGPAGGSVSLLSREELESLGQPADPNYTVSVTGLFGGRGRGRGRGRGDHSSRGRGFGFSRSRKRVSRKRVSRKRVSRKRVSRKRVSRKRVSRKRTSGTRRR